MYKPPSRLGLSKRLDESGELLGAGEGDGIVVGGTNAAYTAMALEARQVLGRGLLQEDLFGLVDVASLFGCA